MKHGYSMLRSDVVQADKLGYNDCEQLLVICPICKEGVFKKIRKTTIGPSHFLSHFVTTAETKQCELRVSKMTQDEIRESGSSVGYGQSIEGLIINFRKIFFECFTDPRQFVDVDLRNEIFALFKNPNFNWFFNEAINLRLNDFFLERFSELQGHPINYWFLNQMLQGKIKVLGLEKSIKIQAKTDFLERSANLTRDVMAHARTIQGTETFRFLFAAAFVMVFRQNLDEKLLWDGFSTIWQIVNTKKELEWLEQGNKWDDSLIDAKVAWDTDLTSIYHNVPFLVNPEVGTIVIRDLVEHMFSMSKMKFGLYVNKWWGRGDKLNLKTNPNLAAIDSKRIFREEMPRIYAIVAVIVIAKSLIRMMPLLPAGRKYFNAK